MLALLDEFGSPATMASAGRRYFGFVIGGCLPGALAAGWLATASFGTDQNTCRVIEAVQREGTCWCGGTLWHDRAAMRISVSSWATTEEDVDRSVGAIVRVASGSSTMR